MFSSKQSSPAISDDITTDVNREESTSSWVDAQPISSIIPLFSSKSSPDSYDLRTKWCNAE